MGQQVLRTNRHRAPSLLQESRWRYTHKFHLLERVSCRNWPEWCIRADRQNRRKTLEPEGCGLWGGMRMEGCIIILFWQKLRTHLGYNPRSRGVGLLTEIFLEWCFSPVSEVSFLCCLCFFVVFCLLFLWRKDNILVRFEYGGWIWNMPIWFQSQVHVHELNLEVNVFKFCKNMELIIVDRIVRVPN